LIERGRQLAEDVSVKTPQKAKATLMALTRRIVVHSNRIEIALSRTRVAELLAGASIDLAAQRQNSVAVSHDIMTLGVPARLNRLGREMRMQVEGAAAQTATDPSLHRVIARAHDIQGRLSQTRPERAHRARGARDRSLHLHAPATALAGPRHHRRNCQRPPAATIQREDVDAQSVTAASRLG
jgi:hypothetical protein